MCNTGWRLFDFDQLNTTQHKSDIKQDIYINNKNFQTNMRDLPNFKKKTTIFYGVNIFGG